MTIWSDLFLGLVEVGKAHYCQAVHKVRSVGPAILLTVMAAIVTLWGLGLLVASVFIGVASCMGCVWAAVISAMLAFAIASVLALIAVRVRR
ncbi:MAG: hypothetical protein WC869_02820 [Phycisphaerae bacterium]|jgi:hypothetical protein